MSKEKHPIAQSPLDDALLAALIGGSASRAMAALKAGASPKATRGNGEPALCFLLARGFEPSRLGEEQGVRILERLLELGADPSAPAPQRGSLAPLELAALYEAPPAALRALVSYGAQLNRQGEGGETALHYALCSSAHCDEKVAQLIEMGADAGLKNKSGDDALERAKKHGKWRAAGMLRGAQEAAELKAALAPALAKSGPRAL